MNRPVRALTVSLALNLFSIPLSGQDPAGGSLASLDDLLGIEIDAAAKYSQTAREAAASVTVITREDIEMYGYRTLADALVQVRGFYGSYDRNYFYLGTRGFGRPSDYNNRVLLLLDGQPINESFYSSASLGSDFALPLRMVERIEVVRGPGSALYGSSAMFAVVNVVSRTGRGLSGGSIHAEMGSFGLRGTSVSVGQAFDSGLELMFSGHWSDTDGQDLYFPEFDEPSTNRGLAEGQDWENRKGLYAVGSYGPVAVRTFAYSRKKAIPTAPWGTAFNQEEWTLDEQWSADATIEGALGVRAEGMFRAYINGYDYEGFYPYPEDYTEYDGNVGRVLGAEGKAQVDISSANRLTLGVDWRRNTDVRYYYGDGEENYFDGDFPFTLFSAFAQDEVNLFGNLVVTFGARLDHHSEVGSHVSPRLALVFHPDQATTLKALVAEAFRHPNAYERYYDDGWTVSNPALEAERIRTIEAVLERRVSQAVFASVSLFEYRVRDLIEQVETEPGEEVYQFQNLGRINARGVEGELTFRSSQGLGGYASGVYQVIRSRPDDERLTNSPQTSFRAGLHIPIFGAATLAGSLLHDGERITVWETRSPAFTAVDLTLSTRGILDRFQATISVKNLFDEEYGLPAGWEHDMATIQQDGRTFRITVGMQF